MRRAITIMLAILTLAPELPAKDKFDWGNVEKLKTGTLVLVVLKTGETLAGRFDSATSAELSITTQGRTYPGSQPVRDIDRESVRRIFRVRHSHNPPDPEKWMLVGTLGGAAVGAAAGGIYDATHKNP